MSDVDAARALLAAGPYNPRTGKLWTLADPELAALLLELRRRVLGSEESARAFLARMEENA